jgi:hypothetical protein
MVFQTGRSLLHKLRSSFDLEVRLVLSLVIHTKDIKLMNGKRSLCKMVFIKRSSQHHFDHSLTANVEIDRNLIQFPQHRIRNIKLSNGSLLPSAGSHRSRCTHSCGCRIKISINHLFSRCNLPPQVLQSKYCS